MSMISRNVVAIVQARFGSTRLPGKVLLDLHGDSMLARVVGRLERSETIDAVAIATSTSSSDDELADYCRRRGWPCIRGNESDVLDRYYQAARELQADAVVRITSDCPLVDPGLCDQVVSRFLSGGECYEYVSNIEPRRTYPRGLDTEVISRAALQRVWHECQDAGLREHVTAFIRKHLSDFRVSSVSNDTDYSSYRWCVDTAEDLELVRAIYAHFPTDTFSWTDAIQFMLDSPALADVNAAVKQKPF